MLALSHYLAQHIGRLSVRPRYLVQAQYVNKRPAHISKRMHDATSSTQPLTQMKLQFIDIGANLSDGMFQGQYMGKEYHPPDLHQVLERAWSAGLQKFIVTAGSLPESRAALQLAQSDERLYCTMGVHPTRCQEIEDSPEGPEAYWDALKVLLTDAAASGKVVAVGECGLDYDRLQFCSKEVQQKWFKRHFELAAACQLPMFLHLRAAASDFLAILEQHSSELTHAVVHSFDDSQQVLKRLLVYPTISIGINGCSLKTAENLAVMAKIPADRLLLETDSPYCDVRPSHAGKEYVKTVHQAKDKKKHDEHMLVKGRNEPCNIVSVFEVVAGHRKVDNLEQFADQIYSNTMQMFFSKVA